MTAGAWTMLGVTWSVIVLFAARFFWKVLTTPPRPDEPGEGADRGSGAGPPG